MRYTSFILLSVLILFGMSCSSDTNNSSQETTTPSTTEVKTTTSKTDAKSSEKTYTPTVVTAIHFTVGSASVTSGGTTCLDITTRDVTDILSIQYSMNWDPKVLQYEKVQAFGIENLAAQNFGATTADKGELATSWYDPSLEGITMKDGSVLYQVCFKAIGEAGSSSEVRISGVPVIKEVSNKKGQILGLSSKKGMVTVE